MEAAAGVAIDGDGRAVLVDGAGVPVRVRPTVGRLWQALWQDAGATVPADELVRRTWGEAAPSDPSASLFTTVTRLRRLLPEGTLRRDGDGYALVLPDGWVLGTDQGPAFAPALREDRPLVGREVLLGSLRAELASGRGVVLHGDPGVGKSRLLDQLVGEAAAAGRPATVLRGRSVGVDVPLGVYAPLLQHLGDRGGLPLLVAARSAIVDRLAGAQLVLGIDDLHQVDPLSAVLTSQLVHGGHALLVGTHRNLRWVHPAVGDLWHEGRVAHVHVPELDRRMLGSLAASLGRRLDDDQLGRLWEMTNGNPLFASVVLQREDLDLPSGDATLDEVIAGQLAGLDPERYDTLVAVAIAEPVRLEVLEQVVDVDALVELERASLVRLDRTGRDVVVRVRHPLYGEHVRAGASRLLARSVRAQLADAVGRIGAVDAAEELRRARWAIDGGRPLEPAAGVAAARTALRADDLELARRIADAVWQSTGDPAAAVVLAEAAYVDRPGRDVVAIATGALARADDATAARLRTTAARAAALKDLDPTTAEALLAPLGPAGAGVRAQLLAYRGLARDALTALGPVEDAVAARRTPDVVAAATALTQLGRAAEALEVLRAAIGWVEAAGPAGRMAAAQLVAATSRPLMVLGRLDEAVVALRGALSASRDAGDHLSASMNALALGGLLPLVGRPAEAHELAVSAAAHLRATGHRAVLRWALMSAGYAAIGDGRVAQAQAALDELATLPTATMTDGVEALVAGGIAAASGRRDVAVEILIAGATDAARRELVFEEACALHDAVRLGAARDSRLDDLGARHGGLIATFAAHAAAIASGEADALEGAGRAFEGHGALALAAEAVGRAAERAAVDGQMRRARQLADASRALAARCDPGAARLPLVAAEPVTPRERELAELAAAGWSNQRIGVLLGISTRTVENHLSRTFQKLGVEGRADVAALLGVRADREPIPDE